MGSVEETVSATPAALSLPSRYRRRAARGRRARSSHFRPGPGRL